MWNVLCVLKLVIPCWKWRLLSSGLCRHQNWKFMSRVMHTQSIPTSENRNLKVILTSRTFLIVFWCLFCIWEESWQINSLHCSQSSWEETVGSTPSEQEVSCLLRMSLIAFGLWVRISEELFANRSGPQAAREYFICFEFSYGPQHSIDWVGVWKSCQLVNSSSSARNSSISWGLLVLSYQQVSLKPAGIIENCIFPYLNFWDVWCQGN